VGALTGVQEPEEQASREPQWAAKADGELRVPGWQTRAEWGQGVIVVEELAERAAVEQRPRPGCSPPLRGRRPV